MTDSIVASVHQPDARQALDEMLKEARFFEVLEEHRAAGGKDHGEFLIAIKPNFMMAVRVEDPPLVYTDPELVEHWIERLAERGFANVRVVESQNVYALWYHNRSVASVARAIGLTGDSYEVRDLTNEQFPYDYGGTLGDHFVGASWRDADFRISFAKNKTHDVSRCTLVIKNTYGCLPARDKFTEYHRKREVDIVTIEALRHFPVHFSAIDASWSLDGPLGYKEGFDVVLDDEGNVLRQGNIHRTDTVIGGADIVAVEHVGMLKMGLDPNKDKRFYKLAAEAFGEPQFEWIGDRSVYSDWVNVGALTSDILDIGEEIPVMSHFLGQSMSHVDESLFPPKTRGWLRRIGHHFGRKAFIRKVRARKGEPASADRLT